MVGATEKDLRWQVTVQFATEWALNGNRLKGKFIPPERHIAAASFAGDDEGLAA